MRKRVLFVGRDPELRKELETYSAEPSKAWTVVFAPSESEARPLLAEQSFDAVVAENNSNEPRGLSLLEDLMRQQPQLLRLVISDPADTRGTLKCIGKGHHHLLKPCRASSILETLEGQQGFGNWRPSDAAQVLIGQMHHLPSPPKIYFQILTELQSPDVWIEQIGELIAQDPAITAKMLQLANSAMFGLQVRVTHPREAVNYIGLETTKALVLLAHTFSSFGRFESGGFSAEELWRHSLAVGRFAKRIARLESRGTGLEDPAFTAGLLHDVGKLLFAENLPKPFSGVLQRAAAESRSLCTLEEEVLGASHAELGACLLGTWGLPDAIVEAVALHHAPGRSDEVAFGALAAVHGANLLAHEAWPSTALPASSQWDLDFLARLQLSERPGVWREHCLESEPKDKA